MNVDERRSECLFCRIADGRESTSVLYSDDSVVAFVPREASARVHIVIEPRRHLPSVDTLTAEDRDLWWHLLEVAQRLARQQGIRVDEEGYHLVANAGRHSSRTVPHLHLHVASGALE